MSVQLG